MNFHETGAWTLPSTPIHSRYTIMYDPACSNTYLKEKLKQGKIFYAFKKVIFWSK